MTDEKKPDEPVDKDEDESQKASHDDILRDAKKYRIDRLDEFIAAYQALEPGGPKDRTIDKANEEADRLKYEEERKARKREQEEARRRAAEEAALDEKYWPDSAIPDLAPIVTEGGSDQPDPYEGAVPPEESVIPELGGPEASNEIVELEAVETEVVDSQRWSPWVKVAAPAIGALIIGGALIWVDFGGTEANPPVNTPAAAAEPADDLSQSADDGEPADGEPTSGITSLDVEPCRSDTDGCDPKGDVAISGTTTEETARGVDVSFVSNGYDFDTEEHQLQVSFSGDAAAVSTAPETEQYAVDITLDTAEGSRSVLLTWQGGVLTEALASNAAGEMVGNDSLTAEWLQEGLLWVALTSPDFPQAVSGLEVSVNALVADASGTGTAEISDTAVG